jgi:hypothetical protein
MIFLANEFVVAVVFVTRDISNGVGFRDSTSEAVVLERARRFAGICFDEKISVAVVREALDITGGQFIYYSMEQDVVRGLGRSVMEVCATRDVLSRSMVSLSLGHYSIRASVQISDGC